MFHGNVSLEIAEGLREIRKRIEAAKIPPSKLDETLNLATWNIREYGRKPRKQAALHYIAEIIGQFDIVSIVELRDDLSDLSKVLDILGPYWHVVYSDMMFDPGGNRERVAYVYDKRAADFSGFAAVANPPRKKTGTEYKPTFNWWRQPYLASFCAGNFDFVVVTAHIQWGTAEGRLTELKEFASWVDSKSKQKTLEDQDIIVTGDFNIENAAMLQALQSKGLQVPRGLRKEVMQGIGTNLAKNKRYDHILHLPRYDESFMNKGGVLDYYTGGTATLFPGMSKNDFTYQMSDHLPVWVQINTDDDGFKLDQLIRAKRERR
jgi:endonuclease/exonuclease/phosphatase family metal-dependent hydrolase